MKADNLHSVNPGERLERLSLEEFCRVILLTLDIKETAPAILRLLLAEAGRRLADQLCSTEGAPLE